MTAFNLTRSFLAVFVPGVVGLAPLLLLLVHAVPDAAFLNHEYPIFFQAAVLSIVIVAGTLFDGLGSRIEVRWDKAREVEYAVDANWWTYLARAHEHDPIGVRYLSRHAAGLAFDLSMYSAVPVFGLGGVALLAYLRAPAFWPIALAIACGIASEFYYRDALDTHELLCESRKELNARMGGLLPPASS